MAAWVVFACVAGSWIAGARGFSDRVGVFPTQMWPTPTPRAQVRMLPRTPPRAHRTMPGVHASSGWLSDIVEELAAGQVSELPVMFAQADESEHAVSFDFERWDKHRDTSRYGRLLVGLVVGVTTRRIAVFVASLVAFTGLVQLYDHVAETVPGLPEFQLPLTPFELTAPVLGLLLVFRTNAAYDRFDLGSTAAWTITGGFRSVMRQLVGWGGHCTHRAEQESCMDLCDAAVTLHEYLCLRYLREDSSSKDALQVVQRLDAKLELPPRPENVLPTPWVALTAFSRKVRRDVPSLDVSERIAIDTQLSDVTSALGVCEKILRTPIPLGYTRYTIRFLFLWLALLPFALVRNFSEFGLGTWWSDKPQPVVMFAMLFIGLIFLSIEDIGVQIEEPFAILPLEKHHHWLSRDAEQIKGLLRGGELEQGSDGSGSSVGHARLERRKREEFQAQEWPMDALGTAAERQAGGGDWDRGGGRDLAAEQ